MTIVKNFAPKIGLWPKVEQLPNRSLNGTRTSAENADIFLVIAAPQPFRPT
jgi:hypothetical protein